MKISSIIIAKDEEANIGRCIKSQLSCIDEIIVLIDDSTKDNSSGIVKSFPQVKYEIVKWKGFSETKEYAVSKTSNDWILWIDADEALTPELNNELINFKKNKPEFSAYSFPRKAYFLGKWIKHSGWYPGRVTRLFDKNKARFSKNEVHEYLIVNGETGKLIHDIEHFTDQNIQHYFYKLNEYTTLASEELVKKGKKFRLLDVFLRPIIIFIKMYIIRRGFLDGIEGFILAVFSSAYVFTKYCKFWERNQRYRE
jgi:glycosyltransferase involved in cell wall biosynthesis